MKDVVEFVVAGAQIVLDKQKNATATDHFQQMTSQWKQNMETLQQLTESQLDPLEFIKALGSTSK